MKFLVSNSNKIIFGWSAKCGCSKIKRIFYYLEQNLIETKIHTENEYIYNLPDNISEYTVIIISRNPYKRLVSGFLEKYNINGEFRKLWQYNTLTFKNFIDELLKNNWEMIEYHHFTKQTSEFFNIDILKQSKEIICFDLENINYKYLESLYNKIIPAEILEKKEGHERKKYTNNFEISVYDLNIDEYYEFNVDIKYFYNNELIDKVYNFYKDDFNFFLEYNINYNNIF